MNELRNMTAIYITKGDEILLLYRRGSRVVGNSWTGSAGGHMEKEELNHPKACVLRELREETGLTEAQLEGLKLRYITMRLKGGEVRQNYYYFAEWKGDALSLSSNEGNLAWRNMNDLNGLDMPVTARHVVDHYVQQGRFTDKLYGCITRADGPIFGELAEF